MFRKKQGAVEQSVPLSQADPETQLLEEKINMFFTLMEIPDD